MLQHLTFRKAGLDVRKSNVRNYPPPPPVRHKSARLSVKSPPGKPHVLVNHLANQYSWINKMLNVFTLNLSRQVDVNPTCKYVFVTSYLYLYPTGHCDLIITSYLRRGYQHANSHDQSIQWKKNLHSLILKPYITQPKHRTMVIPHYITD